MRSLCTCVRTVGGTERGLFAGERLDSPSGVITVHIGNTFTNQRIALSTELLIVIPSKLYLASLSTNTEWCYGLT